MSMEDGTLRKLELYLHDLHKKIDGIYVTDIPVTPQAGSEDDTTKQETPTETNTETPVESVDDTKKQTPVQEENTTQEETSENQQPTTEQNIVSE